MTMVELLEDDRDKLLDDLESSPQPERALAILEKETDKLLYRYNESEKYEVSTAAAADMMQVCRMGLPFVDSIGENVVWTAGESKKKSPILIPVVLFSAGAALLLLSFFDMPGAIDNLWGVFACVSFITGAFLLGRKKTVKPPADTSRQKVENLIDAKSIYRTFKGMMQIVDQNISRAVSRASLTEGTAPAGGEITEGELALYAELLEAMYSRDGEAALDKMEDIRYFLHRNQIEVADYTEENREWFDVMPSISSATIRPALVRDGKLLKKGLAAGGK